MPANRLLKCWIVIELPATRPRVKWIRKPCDTSHPRCSTPLLMPSTISRNSAEGTVVVRFMMWLLPDVVVKASSLSKNSVGAFASDSMPLNNSSNRAPAGASLTNTTVIWKHLPCHFTGTLRRLRNISLYHVAHISMGTTNSRYDSINEQSWFSTSNLLINLIFPFDIVPESNLIIYFCH